METDRTYLIDIVVNGKPRTVPGGLSVEQLLGVLDVPPARVAVERNRSIVRKSDWSATRVEGGDQYEIVWFVGGGSVGTHGPELTRITMTTPLLT